MQIKRNFGLAAAALLALGATFGAAATDAVAGDTRSAAVEIGDLALDNGRAVDELYVRIAAAAEQVCGDYDARDLRARAEWRACYEAAVAGAVASVPHAGLAERHRAKRARADVATRVPAG